MLLNRLKVQKHKFKIHQEQDVIIQKAYQLLLDAHLMQILNRFLPASRSRLFKQVGTSFLNKVDLKFKLDNKLMSQENNTCRTNQE
jgi:hypothetical protein